MTYCKSGIFGFANGLTTIGGLAIMAFSGALFAQSGDDAVREILRPVGQLCLAGQDCVGQAVERSSGGTTTSVAANDTTPAAPQSGQQQSPAPAAEPPQTDPAPQATPPANAVAQADSAGSEEVEANYQQFCFACHDAGVADAPRVGDTEAWEERMQKGMDEVMANVINGLNAMPAKGLCMACTEEDLHAIVEYMYENSQ